MPPTRRSRIASLATTSALLAACSRAAAPGAMPSPSSACVEVCIVEVENRSAMQLDVILRDGLSVRTLGNLSAYGTGSFEVPVGIPLRNIDARLTPGAAAARGGSRGVVCQFHNRGEAAARLVCDVHRG